jgi:hypothetical protein
MLTISCENTALSVRAARLSSGDLSLAVVVALDVKALPIIKHQFDHYAASRPLARLKGISS